MTFPFTANKNSSFDYLSRTHRPRETEELMLLATNYLTQQKNGLLYHEVFNTTRFNENDTRSITLIKKI